MLNKKEYLKINWNKIQDMLPAIIQHNVSGEVLMHGYMNQEALNKTNQEKIVTFYSRTKKRLWTKGESSGNYLKVVNISVDCDYDSILILVIPEGKTCHLDRISCFLSYIVPDFIFLYHLENILKNRKRFNKNLSYTNKLYSSGTKRIAQKVAEEGIETAIAAVTNDREELIDESSDLIFHLLVLLQNQSLDFNLIISNLRKRNK
ncbi:bifunctional phosphoribosyl-AMP cyclohydrolase/phosphoribosyl-ATP diphosphatase HisIE [Buchnera aphidicola (Pemphigus obesinymphae)]|uniref:bifunctional phosphoribosyl-AMP cyclohydrolase/phosphoribosyl-ATP diphosphatase HisIE n=1 Tax=Buchnera aphidicola TaxID=9 RepID=UPI002237847D|nr:bifunctional phosphoribosyl-AMP cyclohydrolase/phosphoribosyl-ATP diphosphatase HisIE [Buchnera aphidicola]MCW5196808.1 bifunctional phosphoribosyl-AMP cyclohydrolase/phosphoribosyl-ATP diphosphatase HisIE [Buchnera aphidicola (Pemphigus obesinymphae)]